MVYRVEKIQVKREIGLTLEECVGLGGRTPGDSPWGRRGRMAKTMKTILVRHPWGPMDCKR